MVANEKARRANLAGLFAQLSHSVMGFVHVVADYRWRLARGDQVVTPYLDHAHEVRMTARNSL